MTREEAIKKIKEAMPTMWKDTKEAIQTVIPELFENENERIIRFFAELATDACGGPGQEYYEEFGLNYDKVMTWLKKQKEQDKCPEYCVRSHCIGCSIYEKRKEDKPSIFPPGLGEARWNPISSVQQKPIFRVGDTIMAKDGTGIPQEMFYIERIEDGFYWEKDNTILISNQDEFQLVEPADNVSKDEYVKKFKVLCDAYEIKLPNRAYDIYHLCGDLAKLFGNTNKQE